MIMVPMEMSITYRVPALLCRRMRYPWGYFCLAVMAMVLVGCSPGGVESDPGGAESVPVGVEAYESLLLEGSGSRITAHQLEMWADQAFREISEVMNAVALGGVLQEEPASSWQTTFSRVLLEHPTDVESLLASYRVELERAERFVRENELVSLPPEQVRVVEAKNVAIRQSFPLALYLDGQLGVTTSSTAEPDPSYLANHCLACIPPLAVHEGYPGHHVGFWHLEHQGSFPSPELREMASENDKNMFLLEGWALYAELLMIEQGYYSSRDALLAALRGQLHRALRARIDVQLHTEVIDRESAVDTYVRELLMTREAAETEVRRHLSQPANKATYFVGLLQILELRRRVLEPEPAVMSLGEFHDRLLRWSLPFPEVAQTVFDVELDLTQVGDQRSVIPLEEPATIASSW